VSGRGLLLFAAALGPSVLISPPCAAADWPVIPEAAPSPLVAVKKPIPTYDLQLGARYWFGWAQTSKRLYDPTGAFLVSRLTYGDNLYTNSGEAYGRIDTSSGFFLKGYLGAGAFTNGHLNDEDFPPGIFPYSSTTSDEKNGYLRYFSLDAGADFLRTPIFRVGAFVGYHFLNEQVSAYGCGQMATNTDVCTFLIPSYVLVITQQNNWNSLRVGVNGEVKLSDRLKFGVDAAWLPYVSLNGTDAHWLRIGTQPGAFTGAIPEDGRNRLSTGGEPVLRRQPSARCRSRRALLAHANERVHSFRESHRSRADRPARHAAAGRLEDRPLRGVPAGAPEARSLSGGDPVGSAAVQAMGHRAGRACGDLRQASSRG
jgi:hypothetical protein